GYAVADHGGVVDRVRRHFADDGPNGTIPAAPEGEVHLVTRRSTARDADVGLFTAVPAGHGAGAGLPVCIVLHGAAATTADFRGFGFGHFVSAAASAGVPPFVLAGVDGGPVGWGPGPKGDDPQALVLDELPTWLRAAGFDANRLALWGWSRGGAG